MIQFTQPSKKDTTEKQSGKVPSIDKEVEQIKEEESSYNNKTELSYLNKHLEVPDRLDYQEKHFLAEFDPSKGELEKKINTIVRIMAVDYTDKQKKRKEFMYWYENWYGKNWQGQSIPPVTDHIEGIYQEQDIEPIIERNKKIGDKRTGQHEVFYIPFSKEKVDELVESSVGSEKETINYVVKTPTMRNGGYTYEQFVNSTFPEAVQMMMKNGGPQLVAMEAEQKANKKEDKETKEEITESKPTVTIPKPQQTPPPQRFPQK